MTVLQRRFMARSLLFVVTAFVAFCVNAQPQEQPSNGEMLLRMIKSYDALDENQNNFNASQMQEASGILSLFGGVEGTARRYEMMALVLASSAETDRERRMLLWFSETRCVPETLTIKQKLQGLKNYLEANPDKWSSRSSDLVLDSLLSTYPCVK